MLGKDGQEASSQQRSGEVHGAYQYLLKHFDHLSQGTESGLEKSLYTQTFSTPTTIKSHDLESCLSSALGSEHLSILLAPVRSITAIHTSNNERFGAISTVLGRQDEGLMRDTLGSTAGTKVNVAGHNK